MRTEDTPSGGRAVDRPLHVSGPKVLTLTYQSSATGVQTADELGALLRQAQLRNRAANVTGVLLFENTRFFQWLEGPEAALEEIWSSISKDKRHGDVQILNREFTRHRLFSDWDMRLVSPGAMFEAVCHQTQAKRALPRKLVEISAQLALDGEADALRTGLEDVLAMGVDIPAVYSGLIEPVTHLLGDWWQQDLCTEREIALALICLRSVVREASQSVRSESLPNDNPLQVLLVAPPEEPHMLGISCASDLYHEAGYRVAVEFPKTPEEIGQLVRSQWFDVLTLSLSDVFTRFDRIDAFSSLIDSVRRQSRNPDMAIIAGGRAFSEKPSLVSSLTADAVYTSVADVVSATRQGLDAVRKKPFHRLN